LPNAIIAVTLPDRSNSYEYFITHWSYTDPDIHTEKTVRTIHTDKLFQIIAKNMFNQKNPDIKNIYGRTVYFGDSSYIITVEWEDFILDIDSYLDNAISLRDNIDEYNLCKEI